MSTTRRASKALTLKDVAKATGFSASTISAAFSARPDPRYREETLGRVREAAEKLGFRVNRQARLLRGGKSQTILLVKSVSLHQTVVETTMAVQEAIGHENYHLISSEIMPAMDVARVINTVSDFGVDGVILQNVLSGSALQPLIEECDRIGVKMVSIEGERRAGVPFFLGDYWRGYEALFEHLIAQGAKRIGLVVISGDRSNPSQWRTKVALETFEAKVLKAKGKTKGRGQVKGEVLVIPTDESVKAMKDKYFTPGYALMKEVLARKGERPDALVFLSDYFAISALKACAEEGVSVPGEMMVAGCDYTGFGQSVSPTLTSLRLPFEKISQQAVKALISAIEGREESEKVMARDGGAAFPLELMVGESTLRQPEKG